jgi:hypothetical protein
MKKLTYKNIKYDLITTLLLSIIIILNIILLLIIIITYIIIYQLYFDSIIPEKILTEALEICNNGNSNIEEKFITINKNNNLNPFIKLFDKSGKYYSYFPSYFLPYKINPVTHNFNLLEYIFYQQYFILDEYSIIIKECTEELHILLNKYPDLNEKLINPL